MREPRGRYPPGPTTSEDGAVNTDDRERTLSRFWAKVNKTDACWLWTGSRAGRGKRTSKARYGHMAFHGRSVGAHRIAYALLVGPLLDGMEIDHLCGNTLCVRPDHLEQVTGAENARRSGPTRGRMASGVCRLGHPIQGRNLLIVRRSDRPGGIRKVCRECQNARYRARYRMLRGRQAGG
jgi:hypothetical protein